MKIIFKKTGNTPQPYGGVVSMKLYTSKKNSKAIPPSSIAVEGKTISDPQNIAENFKNFYQHWQKY